jgi:hypothetical protein
MGRGFPIVSSTKQKLNTQSSTESELVGVDDMMPIIVWSRYFLMAQGYGVTQNLLLQDNKSSILDLSLGYDFPWFAHHNVAVRLRDKVKERFYCN